MHASPQEIVRFHLGNPHWSKKVGRGRRCRTIRSTPPQPTGTTEASRQGAAAALGSPTHLPFPDFCDQFSKVPKLTDANTKSAQSLKLRHLVRNESKTNQKPSSVSQALVLFGRFWSWTAGVGGHGQKNGVRGSSRNDARVRRAANIPPAAGAVFAQEIFPGGSLPYRGTSS